MTELSNFAASLGVVLRYMPERREAWVGLPTTTHPRSKNGRIWVSLDGSMAHVCNWEVGETQTWFAHRERHSDPVMEAQIVAEREASAAESRKRATREIAQAHADAAHEADNMLRAARTDVHPYLAAKGFPAVKGRVDLAERLLIRMEDVTSGKLLGLQTIQALTEGGFRKLFLKGMRSKGGVHRLGDRRSGRKLLVEGYATGLSIEAALRSLCASAEVVVCFSAGNLTTVATSLRGPIGICADNDKSGAGQDASEKAGKPWAMPDEVGEDFNDAHQRLGIFHVRAKIQGLLKLLQGNPEDSVDTA